jgi:hypothetical protein
LDDRFRIEEQKSAVAAATTAPQAVIDVGRQTPDRWFATISFCSVELQFLWPYEERRGYPFRENESRCGRFAQADGRDLKEIGNFNLVFRAPP